MMTLIIGRTASGKDYLAHMLESHFGMNGVLSRTTRPKRSEDDDSHLFVTQTEADTEANKVAQTIINDNIYYTTPADTKDKDFYIIDPNGAYELTKNMPDTMFYIVYVSAARSERKNHFMARSDASEADFEQRDTSEKAQFDAFEDKLKKNDSLDDFDFPVNVRSISVFENDYDNQSAFIEASSIATSVEFARRMTNIVTEAENMGMNIRNKDGEIVATSGKTNTESHVTPEIFASILCNMHDPKPFREFMMNYIIQSERFKT
jgi:dephospho-CoA kinase